MYKRQTYIYVQNGKRSRKCSRISVQYYQTSCDKCRVTNVWPLIGSKFGKNSIKLDKVDKTRCTWPFQAKNRYDVTLANRRDIYGLIYGLIKTCTDTHKDRVHPWLGSTDGLNIPKYGVADEVEADAVERVAHLKMLVSQKQPGFSENKIGRCMPNIQGITAMLSIHHPYENWGWNPPV